MAMSRRTELPTCLELTQTFAGVGIVAISLD
jgi:hypothetical protein